MYNWGLQRRLLIRSFCFLLEKEGTTGATNGGRWVLRTQMRGGQVTLAKEKLIGMRRLGSIGIFLRYNQWLL